MNILRVENKWWADSTGLGPQRDLSGNVWAAQVSLSLRLDAVTGNDSFILPVVSGVIRFDGDHPVERRLHRIITNTIGLAADDVATLLLAIHDIFGAPADDDLTSNPVNLDVWLPTLFTASHAAEIRSILMGTIKRLLREGYIFHQRRFTCVRE